MTRDYDLDMSVFEAVTCGDQCGHFDAFNQCCWLSWWNKEEGDRCNYGLVIDIDGEVHTPEEWKEFLEADKK